METVLSPLAERIVDLAIEEDIGRGDVTTRLTIQPDNMTLGRAIARQDMVMSGSDVFALVMHRVDPEIDVEVSVEDGAKAETGDLLIIVKGRMSSLLMAERVALNFLQRLSGIATLTRQFIDRLPPGSRTRITDTRKTTPGMRFLERRSVRHGGGHNHRVDLAGGILIKENHITVAGSVKEAVKRCIQGAPHPLKVEVEVQSEAELEEALEAGAEAVLLDNMTPDDLKRCVEVAGGRTFLEASGGVNLGNVASIAKSGVDAISVGALTHSSLASDITFLLDRI